MNLSKKAQQIVALKSGTHEEVVMACARASVLAWLNYNEEEVWKEWFAGQFIKTVRRANQKEFDKLKETARAEVVVGEGKALAFEPFLIEEIPGEIKKLQVSNFERESSGKWPSGDGPKLFINPNLKMSTGKTAAQVAHGLFGLILKGNLGERDNWRNSGAAFSVVMLNKNVWKKTLEDIMENTEEKNKKVIIHDAGYTEIPSGSCTVIGIWESTKQISRDISI